MRESQQARDAELGLLGARALKVKQIADLLGVRPRHINRLVKRGELRAFYLGCELRVTWNDLVAYQERAKDRFPEAQRKKARRFNPITQHFGQPGK